MVVVMEPGASPARIEAVIAALHGFGFDVHRSSGDAQVVLGAIGVQPGFDVRPVEALIGVAEVHRVTHPCRLSTRAHHAVDTVVRVGGTSVGAGQPFVMAISPAPGFPAWLAVREGQHAGAQWVSSGIHLPGVTGGSEAERAQVLDAAAQHGMPVLVEVTSREEVHWAASRAQGLLLGPTTMHRSGLLHLAGESGLPVFLYRDPAASIVQWLAAADRVLETENGAVVLVESGIRTFEPTTHRTLDLSAIPALKARSHLPVMADPTLCSGQARTLAALARSAAAAGADGVLFSLFGPQEAQELSLRDALSPLPALAALVRGPHHGLNTNG